LKEGDEEYKSEEEEIEIGESIIPSGNGSGRSRSRWWVPWLSRFGRRTEKSVYEFGLP